MRQSLLVCSCFLILAVIGWVDYLTGYEVSVGPLYFVPIGVATWQLGPRWSVVIAVSAAVCFVAAQLLGGLHYSNSWIVAENVAARGVSFIVVAAGFGYHRKALAQEREKVRRLEGLVTYCGSCHRIADESGHWSDLATYLRDNTTAQPRIKACPDCARAKHFGATIDKR